MTARHHHYLSQCYLKGFTKGKAKNSKLTVFDFKNKKHFETIPRNVGGLRDFNRIEVDGIDPNTVEKAMSDFEGKAASALTRLHESKDFTGDTKDFILNLLALLGVRSPEQRENIRQFEEKIFEKTVGLTLESKERWEAEEAERKIKNPEYKNEITYEALKDFYNSKEYKIELTTAHHIQNEMNMIKAVLPCLYGRNWVLLQSTEESGPFITSDAPVSLTWNKPEKIPPFYRSRPGFCMSDTQVYFPVSADLALIGEFGLQDKTVVANREIVAVLNTKILYQTHRQIYSPKISFNFFSKNDEILDGHRVFNEIKA